MFSFYLKYKSKKALNAFTQAKENLTSINQSINKIMEDNRKKMEIINKKNESLEVLTKQHSKVIQNISMFLGETGVETTIDEVEKSE